MTNIAYLHHPNKDHVTFDTIEDQIIWLGEALKICTDLDPKHFHFMREVMQGIYDELRQDFEELQSRS